MFIFSQMPRRYFHTSSQRRGMGFHCGLFSFLQEPHFAVPFAFSPLWQLACHHTRGVI